MVKSALTGLVIVLATTVALLAAGCSPSPRMELREKIAEATKLTDTIGVYSWPMRRGEKWKLEHKYAKGTRNFERFIEELNNASDVGDWARTVDGIKISLIARGKSLLELHSTTHDGRLVWSKWTGMKARHNSLYLSPRGIKLIQ